MAGITLTYHEEKDGLMYPDLMLPEEGEKTLLNLGRFGIKAMEYLEENHKDRYRTLMRFGTLAEKLHGVDEEANQMMDILMADYLKKNPPKNPQSTMELWNIREQAKMQAEEIVLQEIVMKFH